MDKHRALKEQGYESDSSLVFRKRDDATLTPLSPVEQKQAYKNVQAGGEPPLQGFRKPAPEKPKGELRIINFSAVPSTGKIAINQSKLIENTSHHLELKYTLFSHILSSLNIQINRIFTVFG